jgi:hypothetical protein
MYNIFRHWIIYAYRLDFHTFPGCGIFCRYLVWPLLIHAGLDNEWDMYLAVDLTVQTAVLSTSKRRRSRLAPSLSHATLGRGSSAVLQTLGVVVVLGTAG